MGRPCRYCVAAYPEIAAEICSDEEQLHRDEQRVYDLAIAMASVFQHRPPTDEQVCWFLQDAEAVVDDFDPVPEKWRVRKLPDGDYSEFISRFRINDVTYVIQDGDGFNTAVRLSTYREWMREANREAASR